MATKKWMIYRDGSTPLPPFEPPRLFMSFSTLGNIFDPLAVVLPVHIVLRSENGPAKHGYIDWKGYGADEWVEQESLELTKFLGRAGFTPVEKPPDQLFKNESVLRPAEAADWLGKEIAAHGSLVVHNWLFTSRVLRHLQGWSNASGLDAVLESGSVADVGALCKSAGLEELDLGEVFKSWPEKHDFCWTMWNQAVLDYPSLGVAWSVDEISRSIGYTPSRLEMPATHAEHRVNQIRKCFFALTSSRGEEELEKETSCHTSSPSTREPSADGQCPTESMSSLVENGISPSRGMKAEE